MENPKLSGLRQDRNHQTITPSNPALQTKPFTNIQTNNSQVCTGTTTTPTASLDLMCMQVSLVSIKSTKTPNLASNLWGRGTCENTMEIWNNDTSLFQTRVSPPMDSSTTPARPFQRISPPGFQSSSVILLLTMIRSGLRSILKKRSIV